MSIGIKQMIGAKAGERLDVRGRYQGGYQTIAARAAGLVFLALAAWLAVLAPASQALAQTNYSYDEHGRLKRVDYVEAGLSVIYDYDDAGNRVLVSAGLSAVSFSINDASATEGGNITLTVTKTGVSEVAESVNYATANGTALAGSDYTAKSGTLIFAPTETTKTIVIATINDTADEPAQTFNVNLSAPTGGATISDGVGVGTINDNDPGPAFSINDVSVAEGGTLSFTVTKTGATEKTHNVNYATANGTAVAGSDYTANSGTLSFTAAQASKTVSVTTTQDTTVEANETVLVNLSAATNTATIADSQGVGTIIDDDGVTVSFAHPSGYSASDSKSGIAHATFTLRNDGNIDIAGNNSSPAAGAGVSSWTPDAKVAGNGDPYEARLTVNSGVNPSGAAVGVWVSMSADLSWTQSRGTLGQNGCSATLEIRKAATQTVLATVGVSIVATDTSTGR